MGKRVSVLLIICSVLATGTLKAAETSVHGRLYAKWGMDLTDGAGNANEFSLDRAYMTVKSKLSEFTSLRITTDLREAEDTKGSTQYHIILKYGYIDWKPAFADKALMLRIGLQPTQYIDLLNGLWGRRYLAKTISDERKFLTTADLGVSANVALGEQGKLGMLSAAVYNGTSYSSLGEENAQKDINGYARINPLWNNPDFKRTAITGQIYYGVQNVPIPDFIETSDYKRQLVSAGGLLAYRHTFDLGADLNWYITGQGPAASERTKSGISIFGTLYFADFAAEQSPLHTLNLFGRVDLYDPNTDVADDGDTYVIAGLECVPTKGFKASVNYRTTTFQNAAVTTEQELVFNALFKF